MALARSFQTQPTPVVPSADGAPAASSGLPTSDGSNGAFTPQQSNTYFAFLDDSGGGGSPLAPLGAIYAAIDSAAQLASALSGSVPPALAQTEQLQRKLLTDLQRVPGMTAASLKSITSKLDEARKVGASAVAEFASWLKGELMGSTSDQRPTPPSSAQPVPARPLPPRAVSPAAAPAVDPAVAKTQRLFASTLNEAGSLNQRLVPQMQASRDAWNSAQKQMAQFFWQAAGGQAATPRLQDVLGQLQGSIQALRKAHAQSNEPLAQLKSEQKTLQALQREPGGMGLAPQSRGALGQVDKWAQSAEQWRTTLNERINALEKWAQAAQTAMQARAAAGAQGAAMPLALPPPPAGVAPSVAQAARAAERAQQEQARLPELGGGSTTAVPSGPGAPGAPVEQPRGGASTGGAAGEVAQRWLAQVAEELQRVQQQIATSRRTQLPGGSPEDQAQRERDFYDRSQLARMGVSYNQLQNYLQKTQGPAGTDGAAVRAGMGGRTDSAAARIANSLAASLNEVAPDEQFDARAWVEHWLNTPHPRLAGRPPELDLNSEPQDRLQQLMMQDFLAHRAFITTFFAQALKSLPPEEELSDALPGGTLSRIHLQLAQAVRETPNLLRMMQGYSDPEEQLLAIILTNPKLEDYIETRVAADWKRLHSQDAGEVKENIRPSLNSTLSPFEAKEHIRERIRQSLNTELRAMQEPLQALERNPELAMQMLDALASSSKNILERFSVLDVMRAYLNYKSYPLNEVIAVVNTVAPGFKINQGSGEDITRVSAAIGFLTGNGLWPIDRELVDIFAPTKFQHWYDWR
jgi:hypothetical protein